MVDEALRLHLRYTIEIVEAFGICPWAREARLRGEWRRRVLCDREPDIEPTLAAIAELVADPGQPKVAILIYPNLRISPRAFEELATRVRNAESGCPVFVSATFHPDYPLDTRTEATLVPYLRRSPHPSLQLVRASLLDDLRAGEGKVMFQGNLPLPKVGISEQIASANRAMLDRVTPERIEAVYRDILDEAERIRGNLKETEA